MRCLRISVGRKSWTCLSVFGLLGLLGALLGLFAVVVVLGAALLAGRGWHVEDGLLLILGLELLF